MALVEGQMKQKTAIVLLAAGCVLSLAVGLVVGWWIAGSSQPMETRSMETIDNHPVVLTPYSAEGMVISPSESGASRPGYLMVLVFKADGPFIIDRNGRAQLLGVASVQATSSVEIFEWIRAGEDQ